MKFLMVLSTILALVLKNEASILKILELAKPLIRMNLLVNAKAANSLENILPPPLTQLVIDTYSSRVTKFALDLDNAIENTALKKDETSFDNVIFSPLSLTATLATVLLASSGKTFKEVSKVLGVSPCNELYAHSEILHKIFGLLMATPEWHQESSLPQAKLAFGMFVQKGFPIRDQFKEISENAYKNEVWNLDFENHGQEAKRTINNWAKNKTMGKISSVLSDAPNPSTEIIIASALFFSGEWNQHFIDTATRRRPFYIEQNHTINVDMMYNGGEFPFYYDKEHGVKVINLPYKSSKQSNVSMYVILPDAKGAAALRNFKRKLTVNIVNTFVDKLVVQECIVGIPKMKLSTTLNLRGPLESMGLASLFNPKDADLSLLSSGRVKKSSTDRSKDHDDSANSIESSHRRENTKDDSDIKKLGDSRSVRKVLGNSQNLMNLNFNDRNGTGIRNPGLFADDVIHKVEMTLNEKGTEAAATTIVSMDRSGGQMRLIANRPFVFFVRDNNTKLIWFWATVNAPEPRY